MLMRRRYAARPVGEFGTWLIDKLDEKNMTQTELSDMIHIGVPYISRYQCHKIKPRYTTVVVLCLIFNDDVDTVWSMVERDWA